LTKNHITPWCDGKVVTVLQNLPVVGLCKQLQLTRIGLFPGFAFVLAGDIPKYLPRADLPAVGTGKVKLFVAKPDTFASGENSCPFVQTLVSQIIFRGFYILDINPCDIDGLVDGKLRCFLVFPVAGVTAFFSQNHQSLKLSAIEHFAWRV